eukprot:CAMPEP_0197860748 /NCGR_PEP_ID=MMETSP1438-20131217/36354_1 /TAXON_ID=1461541 /ORGANISM="Pterosperma sp., Strain CCMP1384" /LENGTH=299 /DNA_ID=CAMNT_0043477727 /DNA_START=137 /DNA_END=1039 /DNA_ORIENTATION=-
MLTSTPTRASDGVSRRFSFAGTRTSSRSEYKPMPQTRICKTANSTSAAARRNGGCRLCVRSEFEPQRREVQDSPELLSTGRRQSLAMISSAFFLPATTLTKPASAEEASTAPEPAAAPRSASKSDRYDALSDQEKTILANNQRIASFNNAPPDFPAFLREGYEVKVLTRPGFVEDESGLIYKDYEVGSGLYPEEGQQVRFHYTAYNENGATIDSTFRQGKPAQTQLGIGGMIPGFEMGIRGMKPGGKRRIVVPPDLGPPVGPGTFFSAKQYEVFDVELLAITNCERKGFAMVSKIVCEE